MISVIIPVFNEEKCLPYTLSNLDQQTGDFETIAVDGGSTDRTKNILAQYPWVHVLSAPKGRASQMNKGAAAATGDWLLFLHADTRLPAGALERLDAHKDDVRIQAGGFKQQFSGNGWDLRLISWLHNWRCRITHVMYGDQAMFVRKPLFDRLEGFPESAEMEDIAFGERLLQETRPVLLDNHVVTDSRKFEQMGVWRSLFRVAVILARHEMGLPVARNRFFSDIR